jgi:hypothetical protein
MVYCAHDSKEDRTECPKIELLLAIIYHVGAAPAEQLKVPRVYPSCETLKIEKETLSTL